MDIQQSQQEFENMARLQQERARDRQMGVLAQSDPANNTEYNDIDPEDFEGAKINFPEKPSFPLIMFSFAILKDVLDFAELTIVGIVISWFVTVLFAIIVWFWCRGKIGFIKKFIIKRLVLMVAIGLMPLLGLIPEASIFILWVHFREVSYIGNILKGLEKLEGSK